MLRGLKLILRRLASLFGGALEHVALAHEGQWALR